MGADTDTAIPAGEVDRLQAAWDSIDSLPSIIFTECEAHAIFAALT